MFPRRDASETTRASVKVPVITASFWTIKILTTGLGETTSDFFVRQFDPIVTIGLAALLLGVALVAQWWPRAYSPWRYWIAVGMVAIFGTMVADAVHVVLGVPYVVSTAAFALMLTGIFVAWHAVEGSLSIHSIDTRRREGFYWATVMATFALGTAAGDMAASAGNLGYFVAGMIFCALFAIPLILRAQFELSETATFWAAYILTRPLGASFADWIGVPRARGGLDWGTGPVSIGLAIIAFTLIAIRSRRADKAQVDVAG